MANGLGRLLATSACASGALYALLTAIAWRGSPATTLETWGEVLRILADVALVAGCLVAGFRFWSERPHALRPLLPAAGLNGLLQAMGAMVVATAPGSEGTPAAELGWLLPFVAAYGLALAAWGFWTLQAPRTAAVAGAGAAVLWIWPRLPQPLDVGALEWVAVVAVAAAGIAYAWQHLGVASATRLGAAILAGTAWIWLSFARMSESGGFTLPEAAFVAQALAGAFTLLAGLAGLLAGWRAHQVRPQAAP